MGDTETAEYLNKWTTFKASYNTKDLLTYSHAIGCTDLRFVYENADDFGAFPTYPVSLLFKGTEASVVTFPSPAMMEAPPMPPLSGVRVGLDGERYIEMLEPLDPEGEELDVKMRLIGVHKRGTGASVENEALFVNPKTGKTKYRIVSGAFLVGAKGFKDSGETNSEKVDVPKRAPDAVSEYKTSEFQAHIYRIGSADYNPLHIDPMVATMSGFKGCILHGLCSMGISAQEVLKKYADNDASRFKALRVRFASPVMPGETLQVEMWKEGSKIVFQTKVKETGKVVINNAYMVLNDSKL